MLEDYEEVNVKVTQTFTIETTVTDFDGHDVVDWTKSYYPFLGAGRY